MDFKDHFSQHVSAYSVHRPKSPAGLFEFLSSVVSERRLAWDAGTGNGQSLGGLFDLVEVHCHANYSDQNFVE